MVLVRPACRGGPMHYSVPEEMGRIVGAIFLSESAMGRVLACIRLAGAIRDLE